MAQGSQSPTGFDLVVERVQNKFPYFLLGIALLFVFVIAVSLIIRPKTAEVNDLTNVPSRVSPSQPAATTTPVQKKSIGSRIAEFFQPKQVVTPTAQPMQKTYVVEEGDGLWTVAESVYGDGSRWQDIAAANKLNSPYILEAGQKLLIPQSEASLPSVSPTLSPSPAGETTGQAAVTGAKVTVTGPTYVVQEGECLWNIAESAYGDGLMYMKIVQANEIPNPDLIYPGQRFVLPRN